MNQKNTQIKLYYDPMSAPSKAVWAFLLINKIEHETTYLSIDKQQNKTKEYLEINDLGQVPSIKVIVDKREENIREGTTILRFLANYFQCEENWYPIKNLQRRAKIDWYLDWHHTSTRKVCAGTLYTEFLAPMLRKKGINVPEVQNQRQNIPGVLRVIDDKLSKTKFIADDEISIADLVLTFEVNMLMLIKFDFTPYVNLDRYLKMMHNIKEVELVNQVLKDNIIGLGLTWTL